MLFCPMIGWLGTFFQLFSIPAGFWDRVKSNGGKCAHHGRNCFLEPRTYEIKVKTAELIVLIYFYWSCSFNFDFICSGFWKTVSTMVSALTTIALDSICLVMQFKKMLKLASRFPCSNTAITCVVCQSNIICLQVYIA